MKICARCGKKINYYHYINGKSVCADDRLCYLHLNKKSRKFKKLMELKNKFSE